MKATKGKTKSILNKKYQKKKEQEHNFEEVGQLENVGGVLKYCSKKSLKEKENQDDLPRRAEAKASLMARQSENVDEVINYFSRLSWEEKGNQDDLPVGAEASLMARKTLILLDFNGTLVYRDKNKEIIGRKADYKTGVGRSFARFFIRPGARELICHLLNDPRCKVAIYTSMMQHNCAEIVEAFDRHFLDMSLAGHFDEVRVGSSVISSHSSVAQGIIRIFDRDYNSTDPEGENSWDTIRDFSKIFRDMQVQQMGFDISNTCLIEATPRKAKNVRANTIICPEYTKELANSKNQNQRTLLALRTFIDEVLLTEMQSSSATVASILEQHIF